ncbi:MAG TPA: choice-of-anchor D domain-containing protein, partial [Pseudolabrys sp.]
TAVAGTYDISIAATTEGQSPQVTHTFTYSMTIEAAPSFTFATPTSYPTITNKSSWETWMTTYGAFYCAQDYGFQINPANGTVRPNNSAFGLCGIGVENCSWYYDGGRVYWQVRDYDQAHALTGNPTQWNQCIANVNALYRDGYVLAQATPGKIPGYTVFPLGETQDWLRNSDIASKNSVNAMTLNSAYGTASGTLTNANALVEPDQIRETAYMINACISNQQNGNVCSAANLNFYIGAALGHIMQWTTDGSTAFNQPFMSGLECEALLRAYDYGIHDPRIPAYCKLTWDWLYANAWQKDSSGSGFWYNNNDYLFGIQHSDMRPLNNMVAPMAAWVFKSSGTQSYATQALAVFDGWVSNGTNNFDSAPYGKTFSQGYRWSFDLISWLSPPTSTTVTVSPLTATIPVLGSQVFSSNPSGATWTKSSGCTGSIGASTGAFTASSTPETCQVTATVSGNSGSGTVTSQAVSVLPATVSLQVGATQTFTGNFPGVWSVSGGSITQAGVYTAPQVNGTYTVTLTATNGGSTGTATVTVSGQATFIPLTTSPTSWNYGTVAISTPSSKQFTISNIGTGTVTINTQAITVGGTKFAIDTNTCGATLAGGASCTFNVTFNSSTAGSFSGNLQVADSAGGTTNVPLTATVAGATTVSVTPTAVTLPYSGIQQFSANVAVTWATSCVGGGGSITSVGFFTAPAAATTCTVTATASDGSGANAQANVTVNALSVNPVAVTLQVNSKQQFTANFAASWAVTSGTCTISAGGLLTAPGTNTSCIVRATAQNGGSTATASVSVVGAPSSTPGTQLQTVTMDAGTIR